MAILSYSRFYVIAAVHGCPWEQTCRLWYCDACRQRWAWVIRKPTHKNSAAAAAFSRWGITAPTWTHEHQRFHLQLLSMGSKYNTEVYELCDVGQLSPASSSEGALAVDLSNGVTTVLLCRFRNQKLYRWDQTPCRWRGGACRPCLDNTAWLRRCRGSAAFMTRLKLPVGELMCVSSFLHHGYCVIICS